MAPLFKDYGCIALLTGNTTCQMGGWYRKEIKTVAVGAQWVVGAGVADNLVYDVTKALWNDNSRRLFDAGHAKARDIQLASALKAVNTPLHPGAERFYKEKGVIK